MPIDVTEHYKTVFEQHRFASEYRLKLSVGWAAVYGALAVAFAWVTDNTPPLAWMVPLMGAALTFFFWLVDRRHQPANYLAKKVGRAIEEAENLPENQRYYSAKDMESRLTHKALLNWFTAVAIVLLLAASGYLFCARGVLPK